MTPRAAWAIQNKWDNVPKSPSWLDAVHLVGAQPTQPVCTSSPPLRSWGRPSKKDGTSSQKALDEWPQLPGEGEEGRIDRAGWTPGVAML